MMFKIVNGGVAPTRATKYSAMVDLYANADVVIGAGETKIIPLGIKIDTHALGLKFYEYGAMGKHLIDWERDHAEYEFKSHYLELHPRSSLRAKGLIIGVGIIDLDYHDELGLIVHNPTTNERVYEYSQGNEEFGNYVVKKHDKIAQCTLVEHKGYLMGIESDTERTGGFGSSDK